MSKEDAEYAKQIHLAQKTAIDTDDQIDRTTNQPWEFYSIFCNRLRFGLSAAYDVFDSVYRSRANGNHTPEGLLMGKLMLGKKFCQGEHILLRDINQAIHQLEEEEGHLQLMSLLNRIDAVNSEANKYRLEVLIERNEMTPHDIGPHQVYLPADTVAIGTEQLDIMFEVWRTTENLSFSNWLEHISDDRENNREGLHSFAIHFPEISEQYINAQHAYLARTYFGAHRQARNLVSLITARQSSTEALLRANLELMEDEPDVDKAQEYYEEGDTEQAIRMQIKLNPKLGKDIDCLYNELILGTAAMIQDRVGKLRFPNSEIGSLFWKRQELYTPSNLQH